MKNYFALFLIGLGVRLAAFAFDMPFRGDVLTFQLWAIQLFEGGLSLFYYADTFTDYPPMYMYVLWVAGALRDAFGFELLSWQYNLLVFTPAIVSDLITGLLLYRLFGRWVSLAYLLNPAVILNSSVWGQVDAIHTLLLFLAVWAVIKKQSLPVYLLYGAAVLTKPQSLIVAPIFLYSAFHHYRESGYDWREGVRMLGYAILTFAFMALLSLPFAPGFDLSPILRQYADTLGSYPFASVNAYNFYALTGGNWQEITLFYFLVSAASIVGVTCMVFWLLYRRWADVSVVFFSAGLLYIVTFVFSVRMHERYLFPALLFLLIAAAVRFDKKLIVLYAAFSVTLFVNCLDILLQFNGIWLFDSFGVPLLHPMPFRPVSEFVALVSALNVALAVYSLKVGRDFADG